MRQKIIAITFSIFFLVSILFSIPNVYSAEITGIVYNYYFEPVKNAIVNINTNPTQQIIAKNSTYSFNVPIGTYTISSKYYNGNTLEFESQMVLNVTDNGKYIIDIIMFPTLDEDEKLFSDSEYNYETIDDVKNQYADQPIYTKNWFWTIIILLMVILVAMIYQSKKKEKNKVIEKNKIETENKGNEQNIDSFQQALTIIQKNERMTQKDLRKIIPLSEAKISLILSEMEEKGLIEKIKKGRGNIIIIKKQ